MITVKLGFPKIKSFNADFIDEKHLESLRYFLTMSYGTFTINDVELRPNLTVGEILAGKEQNDKNE